MQRHRLLLPAILAMAAALISPVATAQISAPAYIDYQGRLTDINGNPLGGVNGINHTLQFRIYDAESGGSLIWAEEQTVTIIDGAFSVRLGEGIEITGADRPPLVNAFDGSSRYLGITVVGQGGEITPRLAFLSAPFAIVAQKAAVAESLNQTLGTTQTSSLNVAGGANIINLTVTGSARVNGNNTLEFGAGISGKQVDAGKIGYATFTPGTLDIVGAGTNTDGSNRKIKLWGEGGIEIRGPISSNSQISAASFSSQNYQIPGEGKLHFGTTRRQMLNLWDNQFGIGIQDNTLYNRSNTYFAWYKGGIHSNLTLNAGGGTHLASLDSTGLWVGEVNGGYGSNSGIYVRGSRGIIVESSAPGWWTTYHDVSIGNPGHSDYRLRYANQGEFFWWNSLGSSGRSSDRTLKKDIEPVSPVLDKVLALKPVSFRYKSSESDSPKNFGFIAQDVKPHFPNLVSGEEGSYGLAESSLVSVTVAALQEENAQRTAADEKQASELEKLKAENAALLKRIEALERHLSIK